MELFKVLIIIGILGVIFGLLPLGIYYGQKRENQNRIKKVNLKKMMIWYYVIITVVVIVFGGFIYLDKKYDITKSKPKTYTIPEPKVEVQDEWFEEDGRSETNKKGEYVYIPSKRFDYSEENKEKLKTMKAKIGRAHV